jgi:hypothetical protein
MTPSIETKTAPVSLRIGGFTGERRLDPGDVDLLHRHHCIEGTLGGRLVAAGRRFEQDSRRDLPGEAPFVLAPAAGAFLTAVADNGVPIFVGLGLVFGDRW